MEYYLYVTNACNLGCKYCSVMVDCKNNDIPLEPSYSIDSLKLFIDSTQTTHASNTANIVFFGGEPSLNLEFVESVIAALGEGTEAYSMKYMFHTNGLLLSRISPETLRHIDAIMLSVNYTEIPRYNLDRGYFCEIVAGIRYVKTIKNIPVIGRFTITEDTSLYSCVTQMHHFFDYIHWQIENCLSFKNFDKFLSAYEFDVKNLLSMWYSFLEKGVLLNIIPFIAAINFINEQNNAFDFNCGYNKSMVYIQTDGTCYLCCDDNVSANNAIGNVTKGFSFVDFSLKDTPCKNCVYLSICRGRCGRMHKDLDEKRVKEYCELNRSLFDFIVLNKEKIMVICADKGIEIAIDTKVAAYTEYTP